LLETVRLGCRRLPFCYASLLMKARVVWAFVGLLAVATAALELPAADSELRAVSLLLRIADPGDASALAHYGVHAVEQSSVFTLNEGKTRARVYRPVGVEHAPGMVIVHGVHRLGIDEPRLVAFARDIAASGIVVLTPELRDVADYRITPASIAPIGEAARELAQMTGATQVSVMGLSFAGGLAMLAAADPRWSPFISSVVSVGGHDDLQRVTTFFATDEIPRPDGTVEGRAGNEDGALVLVYAHPEDFFPAADVAGAREAIRLHLWEQPRESDAVAAKLSPTARATLKLLFEHKKDAVRQELLASIAKYSAEMAAVSPHGHLQTLRADVLLLHGSEDSVIPAVETEWLAHDADPHVVDALITPLLTHVDVGKQPPLRERLQLVHFMADMLSEANGERRRH
jgi:dienelactone hydrolase